MCSSVIKLSPGAKLDYAMLLKYAWQNDCCFPGQERLAKDMGVTRQSANTYVQELSASSSSRSSSAGRGRQISMSSISSRRANGADMLMSKFLTSRCQKSFALDVKNFDSKNTKVITLILKIHSLPLGLKRLQIPPRTMTTNTYLEHEEFLMAKGRKYSAFSSGALMRYLAAYRDRPPIIAYSSANPLAYVADEVESWITTCDGVCNMASAI